MTLCCIVSAYCGPHASLTNVSQTFKYANVLLKRCSKIGRGDVMLLFQDLYGQWTKYKWMNWTQTNGRKSILNHVTKQQNLCLQQLQNQAPPLTLPATSTMLDTLKECMMDCNQHQQKNASLSFNFIYHIVVIGNEHSLSFNDEIYLNSLQSNIKLQDILSLSRNTPININMLCLCSPLTNKTYREFSFNHNCCSVCNQQFFRTKPNKKQHFPKSCHQIALKQIEIQKIYRKCQSIIEVNPSSQSNTNEPEPPLKRRKMNENEITNEDSHYDIHDMLNSCAVLFWQSMIDHSSGIFRWILTDFNQSNIDLVFISLTNQIASHSKMRHIALGCLMGQCMIFPGPNNHYFHPPNNSNHKIKQFQSMNEKQIRFEMNQHMGIKGKHSKYNNAFLKAMHENMNSSNEHCPFNILQENNTNISTACDVLSILGFLEREHQWLPIPILSRHYVIPFESNSRHDQDTDLTNTVGKSKGADVCVFIKEMLYEYNRICLVNLNPPNKPSWYGFMHCELKSKEKHLLLDILSPFINVEALLRKETKGQPTPQYKIQINNSSNVKQSMLNIFDSASAYFPSDTNVIKEFDKFIRLLKQKKVLECFDVAESIRRRSVMFHIPHLMTHLLSISKQEMGNVTFDLPKQKQLKHKLNILLKLIADSQKDHRVKIVWNPPKKQHRHKNHGSKSHQKGKSANKFK
eukprot:23462_1